MDGKPIAAIGIAGDGGTGGSLTISGGHIQVSGDVGGGPAGKTSLYSKSPGTGGNGSSIAVSGGTVSIAGVIGGGNGSPWVGDRGGDGTCVITGGSFAAPNLLPVPTNGAENGIRLVLKTQVTLEDVSTAMAVRYLLALTDYTYGTKDMSTDARGQLSIWLPDRGSVQLIYTNNTAYSGAVAAGTAGVLHLTPYEHEKPTVLATTPVAGARNVPANGSISVTFSESMETAPGSVTLSVATGNPIVLTGGSWSANNTIWTITYAGLIPDAVYTWMISDFMDLAGNLLEAGAANSFQVAPAAIIPIHETAYVDEKGVIQTASAIKIDGSVKTLADGWYAVEGALNLANLNISGHVRLILMDGCKLVTNGTDDHAAIRVTTGNSLTLYGQMFGTGALNATSAGRGAGIGGNGDYAGRGEDCGNVTICSGMITTSSIGGGTGGFSGVSGFHGGQGGAIAIQGGMVIVSGRIGGGDGGPGIPNQFMGGNGGDGSSLSITGGTVTVSGKIGGGTAGMGRSLIGLTGRNGAAGTCVITGGSLKAANLQPAPTNGPANGSLKVIQTIVTLGGVVTPVAIKTLVTNLALIYGNRDVKTDMAGKLYLWLPASASVTEAFAQTSQTNQTSQITRYTGYVAAGAAGTLTLASLDLHQPVVIAADPADGTDDLPLSGKISITFSKVMDPGKGSLILSADGSNPIVLSDCFWSYSGTVFTVAYSGLSYGTSCSIDVSGFQDLSGLAADRKTLAFTSLARPRSVTVGAPSGSLICGTAGRVTVPVSTYGISNGSAIALENLNNIPGLSLVTLSTAGDTTAVIIRTTGETPVGTHPLALTIDGIESTPFNLTVGTPIYGIMLSETGNLIFPEMEAGYSLIEPHRVDIANTGNSPTGAIDISLTGENSSSFALSKSAITNLGTTGLESFTVRPIDGLAIGAYVATVTVSGTNLAPFSFDVRFTVKIRTGNSIISVIQPAGAALIGTHIAAIVTNSTTSQVIDLTVSPGANWKIYRDVACTDEILDRTLTLAEGANLVFIQVTAEDGTVNLYAMTLERLQVMPGPSPNTQVIIGAAITSDGGTLQLTATIETSDSTDPGVVWRIVSGQEFASISPDGLITAEANGIVIARATAADGSEAYQDLQISISGQQSAGLDNSGGLIDQPRETGKLGDPRVGNDEDFMQNGSRNNLSLVIWLSLFALMIIVALVLIRGNRQRQQTRKEDQV